MIRANGCSLAKIPMPQTLTCFQKRGAQSGGFMRLHTVNAYQGVRLGGDWAFWAAVRKHPVATHFCAGVTFSLQGTGEGKETIWGKRA